MQGSTVESCEVGLEPELLGAPEPVESTVEYVIPTGEGLTPKEARNALLEAVNAPIKGRNEATLRRYRTEMAEYRQAVVHNANLKEGDEPVVVPKFPTVGYIQKTLNSRQIQQAVFIARQRGGYGSLLEAAGYRAKK